jgi:6-phosphogluconolactonase
MKPVVTIFHNDIEMAEKLAIDLQSALAQAEREHRNFYLAISGGTTPITFYKRLAQVPYKTKTAWQSLHLFWGDERCVPPDHIQSNYNLLQHYLLPYIHLPETNIHRLQGEADPEGEARRYAAEIKNTLPYNDKGWPQFDWILLGLGSDGHTASLFPASPLLNEMNSLCAVAVQPDSGQKRITFTLPLINHARRITFLVTGESKAGMVARILKPAAVDQILPAAQVHPEQGVVEWYLDSLAAAMY